MIADDPRFWQLATYAIEAGALVVIVAAMAGLAIGLVRGGYRDAADVADASVSSSPTSRLDADAHRSIASPLLRDVRQDFARLGSAGSKTNGGGTKPASSMHSGTRR